VAPPGQLADFQPVFFNMIPKYLSLSILMMLLSPASVEAKSPVWEVSNDTTRIYVGGTIHVLSAGDYPLPSAFETAYKQSDTLVFETDISAVNRPDVQARFQNVMMFQDGRTLKKALKEETYVALDSFLRARGMAIASFERLTPAGISLTLTLLELQRLGLAGTAGVDAFFDLRGKQDGKPIEELESIDEQIAFINSFNQADPDDLVLSTLKDTENLNEMWGAMLSAWRAGDLMALEQIGDESLRQDYPEIATLLLDQRNENWMREIPAMLEDADVEFVLVGALHLVGEKGLLNQLSERGFTVTQLGG
jgi:uncharacterized protein YbaP (TraB family)